MDSGEPQEATEKYDDSSSKKENSDEHIELGGRKINYKGSPNRVDLGQGPEYAENMQGGEREAVRITDLHIPAVVTRPL